MFFKPVIRIFFLIFNIINCKKSAKALSDARKDAAKTLEKRITEELRDLSMPSVRFKVSIEKLNNEVGFDAYGADEIRFLVS